MTKLLAIETSAETCSVALHLEGHTTEFFEHAPMRHAELLLPAVRAQLESAGMSLADLDAIAFGRGPGSFTSLRIGIGVVQGLAWGAQLPVVPVSSLAAVAQDAASRAGVDCRRICVAVDARMQEVYSGVFRLTAGGAIAAEGEEIVCPPAAVELSTDEPFIAAGNGFERFGELKSLADRATLCVPDACPRAERVIQLALDWLGDNEALPAAMAQPVYIRNKVANKPSP